jgi:hypothetical protein
VRSELASDARRVALVGMVLDRLRAEFEGRGVDVQDGWWGYRLLVVRDPDGNELYFNYPSNDEPPPPRARIINGARPGAWADAVKTP